MKYFFKTHAPWILLMVAITIQSGFPDVALPDIDIDFIDKILHFFIFGLLGWFLCRGMNLSRKRWIHEHYFFIALVIGALFAISDEWHQSFVEGRDSSLADWLADLIGMVIFSLIYRKIRKVNWEST
jgi:VanZ family protein